ncbi:MAG: hypothetical protein A3F68_04880 [Acidobacteria bacterium RIFCSPLOWO2_12_FULL_54_10]|nr:MAG: hypothetical protein A3F68_04880 [Acidobacteria bacterium RIFCSPLOWO2_12_FULL_54_10]
MATNTGSYPRIGSRPEFQVLRQAIAQRDKGTKTDADVKAAEDAMTRAAIEEQTGSGLDMVTDGQIRWYDPISHVAGKLENITINGLMRYFDTNSYFRQPVVKGPIRWKQPVLRPDYEKAVALSSRPVKPVLTGAITLARHSIVEHPGYESDFGSLVRDYNMAIAQEVKELAAAGAAVIQIDEPVVLKNAGDLPLLNETLKVLSQVKGKARLALYVYFGDPGPVLSALLDSPADIIGLDFTYNTKLIDQVAAVRPKKPLGLGLLDGRNTKLENADQVAKSLERLLKGISAEECYLNPSSGLEYLPRDRALQKLKHLVAIKNRVA